MCTAQTRYVCLSVCLSVGMSVCQCFCVGMFVRHNVLGVVRAEMF